NDIHLSSHDHARASPEKINKCLRAARPILPVQIADQVLAEGDGAVPPGGGVGVHPEAGHVLRHFQQERGGGVPPLVQLGLARRRDRKSTRLNSSHVSISYAVFCLTKKNTS